MELTAFVMSFVVLLRKRLRWESYNFRYSGPKAQRHLPGLKSDSHYSGLMIMIIAYN